MKDKVEKLIRDGQKKSNVVKGSWGIFLRKIKILFQLLVNGKFRSDVKGSLNTAYRKHIANLMKMPTIPVNDLVDWGSLEINLKNATQNAGQTSHLELLCILANVRQHISENQNFLEIGTYDGNTALNVACNLKENSKIYTIDLPYDESQSAKFAYDDALVKNPKRKLKKHKDMNNVVQIYADSTEFDFSDISFNGAFIDGGHDYDVVFADTVNVITNIQKPGFILWHDYEVECEIGDILHSLIPEYDIKHIEGTRMAYLFIS